MVKLNIAVGKSRKDTHWQNKVMTWAQLVEKIKDTTRTHETVNEYKNMSKDEQSAIKDVGGFVGGHLIGGRRTKSSLKNRSLVTLDIDYAGESFWEDFTLMFDYAAAIYSTHKHTSKTPRYRLIIPLSEPVGPEQYEAIARRIADDIGIDLFDDTTYQPSRLMYWPSTSKDGVFEFHEQEGPILDPQTVLDTYDDWSDVSFWPHSSRVTEYRTKQLQKQQDPTLKKGTIGAFCRAYTITEAIDTFLSDVYEPCDIEGRYTYVGGSTSAGLVIYDDKYAYSNHSTDPAGGMLCNAFDLVRIHKFSDMDKDAPFDTQTSKLPSYQEALKFISDDARVKKEVIASGIKKDDFADVDAEAYDDDWMEKLEMDKGKVASTIDNIVLILNHDPNLKGIIGYNEFDHIEQAIKDMPWRTLDGPTDHALRDSDDSNVRHYLERNYKITGKEKIRDAMKVVASKNSFHPVKDYLESLEWDGKERVDTLLIDYLGAEDNEYVRTVTHKTLVAAVARIYEPGCKFDYMLTLYGPQGIGKSTLFAKLGSHWFSDSLTCVSGKESYEQLQGVWIMEMGELAAMKKAEVEAVKSYISKREDRYRRAYGERIEVFPRQNIFIGTTNEDQFLRDDTGGRRFWVVDLVNKAKHNMFKELTRDEIDQVWAEAMAYYEIGEELKLNDEMEAHAKALQEAHSVDSPKLGMILDYVDRLLPNNWNDMDLFQRKAFLEGDTFTEPGEGTVLRQQVCAAEVWCEVFDKKLGDLSNYDAKEINKILAKIPGWEKQKNSARFGKIYGTQRGYRRKNIS